MTKNPLISAFDVGNKNTWTGMVESPLINKLKVVCYKSICQVIVRQPYFHFDSTVYQKSENNADVSLCCFITKRFLSFS